MNWFERKTLEILSPHGYKTTMRMIKEDRIGE